MQDSIIAGTAIACDAVSALLYAPLGGNLATKSFHACDTIPLNLKTLPYNSTVSKKTN